MIRHVKELQPNLENLVALSISNVDENKLKLKERVAESLSRLEEQTLISKSGDSYYFLTNEEQEINREIKNTDVEKHSIIDVVSEVVFNSNDICPTKYMDYKFNRSVDDRVKTVTNAELTIKFLTPLADEIIRGSGQQSLHGENLSNIDSTDTLLFVFPSRSKFTDQIKSYLQIEKYIKQNPSNRNDPEITRILVDKRQEAERTKESSVLNIQEGLKDAKIFIDGKEVTSIEKKNPKERVMEGFKILIKNVYSKSSYVTVDYASDNDILRILRSDDLEKFGIGKSDINKLALYEVLNYISIRDEKNTTVVLKDLKEHFMKKPFGWKDMTISGLIATLFVAEEVKLRYQKTSLVSNAEEIAKYLTRREDADKLIIEIRKKTGTEIINSVRSILRDVFDKTDIPEKENDLYSFSHKIITDELLAVKEISGKYAEEKRYPGKVDIENYAAFLNRIQSVTDSSAFLKTMADEKNELVGLRHKVEPMIAFFDGPQVGIFRRVSKKIENFRRNAQFLNDEARSNVDEIESILTCAEPYSKIKLLPQLESGIEASLQISLSKLKQDVQTKLTSAKGELKKELGSYKGFRDEFKRSVFDAFNDIEKTTIASDDCAFVKLQISRVDELVSIAYERIEKEKHTIKETESGDVGIKAVPVEMFKAPSLFISGKNIETEDDLEEYLVNLRAAMRDILKTKKIRVY
jgi:glutaredoxin